MPIVAALLLTPLATIAAAAERPERFIPEHFTNAQPSQAVSKKALKLIATLEALGLSDPEIKGFVYEMDSRIDKRKYLRLHEEKIGEGTVTLRYKCKGFGLKQAELHYAPSADSPVDMTARTDKIMVNYQLRF